MTVEQTVKMQRLGAIGATAGAVGILVLWAVVFGWLATARVPTAGLDWVNALLIRLTTFFPALAIASVHLAMARKLSMAARISQ